MAHDAATFTTNSMVGIQVTEPWCTELKISRIVSGTGAMTGYAHASNQRSGFRWVRDGEPVHHVDKAWLDRVTIYVGDTDEVWGRGRIIVYRTDNA